MKTSKLDLIAMQKQFDDILSKLTKEEVEEYCNEINAIKTRIGYKESQPVISEEEIKKANIDRAIDILYKKAVIRIIDNKIFFSRECVLDTITEVFSSNDKQEKNCSSGISDVDLKYGDYVQMDDRFESVHIWSKELEERNAGRWVPKKISKDKYEEEMKKSWNK